MTVRRVAAVTAAATLLVAAGCSSGPWGRVHRDPAVWGDAAVTSAAASLARDSKLGPDSFGKIKLGMSLDQVKATGQFTFMDGARTANCGIGRVTGSGNFGGGVYVSPKFGVALIEDYPGVRTPEGIGAGSTLDAVQKAYPGLREEEVNHPTDRYEDVTKRQTAPVPGNSSARYIFYIAHDAVESMALVANQQDCDPGE